MRGKYLKIGDPLPLFSPEPVVKPEAKPPEGASTVGPVEDQIVPDDETVPDDIER